MELVRLRVVRVFNPFVVRYGSREAPRRARRLAGHVGFRPELVVRLQLHDAGLPHRGQALHVRRRRQVDRQGFDLGGVVPP